MLISVTGGAAWCCSTARRIDFAQIGPLSAMAIRSASCTASWLSRAASCRIFKYSRTATREPCC